MNENYEPQVKIFEFFFTKGCIRLRIYYCAIPVFKRKVFITELNFRNFNVQLEWFRSSRKNLTDKKPISDVNFMFENVAANIIFVTVRMS